MKKVIFILRGLGREQGHWAEFPELLEKELVDVEVVKIDLPGFGFANLEDSPLSISGIVKKISSRGVFDEYKSYDEKYILGLSLGGMVTLETVVQKPNYFNGVILMNSSQKYKTSVLKRVNFKFVPKGLFAVLAASTKKREAILFDQTINTSKNRAAILAEWSAYFKERPYKRSNFFAQLLAAAKFSLKGKDLSGQRGMILSSKADRLVNWRASQALSELLNWPVHYHNNAGHDLSFDDPAWICNKVSEFINK